MVKTIKISEELKQQLDDIKGSKTYSQIIEETLWINQQLRITNQQTEELVQTFKEAIGVVMDNTKNKGGCNMETYEISHRSFRQIIQRWTNNDGYTSTIYYNMRSGMWVESLQELIEHPIFSNPKKQKLYINFIKKVMEFMGEFEDWSQGARVNSSYMNDYGHIVTRLE